MFILKWPVRVSVYHSPVFGFISLHLWHGDKKGSVTEQVQVLDDLFLPFKCCTDTAAELLHFYLSECKGYCTRRPFQLYSYYNFCGYE